MNLIPVIATVAALGLGAESFKAREASQRTLSSLGPWGYVSALRVAGSRDPEVRRRAQDIAAPHARSRRVELVWNFLAADGWTDWPQLDFYIPYQVVAVYREELLGFGYRWTKPDWMADRIAFREWVADGELSAAEVRDLVRRRSYMEYRACVEYGWTWANVRRPGDVDPVRVGVLAGIAGGIWAP